MTLQFAILDPLPSGLELTLKVFAAATPKVEITGNDITSEEADPAKGLYEFSIERETPLPAGDYVLRAFHGADFCAAGNFRFLGVDGETATEVPAAVELSPAILGILSEISEKLGTPAEESVSEDIAVVKGLVELTQASIGLLSPASTEAY